MANTFSVDTIEQVIHLTIPEFGAPDGPMTVGQFLFRCMANLWTEGEQFNGKYPTGDGGWDYDIFQQLIVHGIVEGSLDEFGYVEQFDREAADDLMAAVIRHMRNKALTSGGRRQATVTVTGIRHFDGLIDIRSADGDLASVPYGNLPKWLWLALGHNPGEAKTYEVTIPDSGPWADDIEWLES